MDKVAFKSFANSDSPYSYFKKLLSFFLISFTHHQLMLRLDSQSSSMGRWHQSPCESTRPRQWGHQSPPPHAFRPPCSCHPCTPLYHSHSPTPHLAPAVIALWFHKLPCAEDAADTQSWSKHRYKCQCGAHSQMEHLYHTSSPRLREHHGKRGRKIVRVGVWGEPEGNCFLDVAGPPYSWMHGICACLCKTCTGSSWSHCLMEGQGP